MLKLLVKKQFLEMFRSFFYNQKTQRARSAAASVAFVIGYALLMVVVIGGSLGDAVFRRSACRLPQPA